MGSLLIASSARQVSYCHRKESDAEGGELRTERGGRREEGVRKVGREPAGAESDEAEARSWVT